MLESLFLFSFSSTNAPTFSILPSFLLICLMQIQSLFSSNDNSSVACPLFRLMQKPPQLLGVATATDVELVLYPDHIQRIKFFPTFPAKPESQATNLNNV